MPARDLAWLPCAAALVLGCGRALAAGDGHSDGDFPPDFDPAEITCAA